MANHLAHVLSTWYPQRNETEWVLGTIYATQGSSYRKAGAMMLFGGLGQQLGMLSGGCLENDIQRHARRVMQTGEALSLTYDGLDEDDVSFQFGIGCGGVVKLHLQLVCESLNYLGLEDVHLALQSQASGHYRVDLSEGAAAPRNSFVSGKPGPAERPLIAVDDGLSILTVPVRPVEQLLIVGGGADALPLSQLAAGIGWGVSVWDPRPAYARPAYFPPACHLVRGNEDALSEHLDAVAITAAVVMSHSVAIDAGALKLLSGRELQYVALLGPPHRRVEVLEQADLQCSPLPWPLAGPAGLDLGGELPEQVALSILAECQAVLSRRDAGSLSLALDRETELPASGTGSAKPAGSTRQLRDFAY